MSFSGKTVFITGASRGIGAQMALHFAKEGANVVIAAKTKEPHPKLPGTIDSVAQEARALGGKALPVQMDVRDEAQVKSAVEKAVDSFGGIDILINNASAIFPMPTLQTPMKRFDLMFDCNIRATFMCSQICIPHLRQSQNPHILNLSPPIGLDPKWFKNHLAYTMSKYGMSMCTIGLAEEFASDKIAVNSLWPKTLIATSAVQTFFPQLISKSRKAEIVADAAVQIVARDSASATGQFFVDEDFLRQMGVEDFDKYAFDPTQTPQLDLYI